MTTRTTGVRAGAVRCLGAIILFAACGGAPAAGPGALARGDSLAELGRYREARRAYERAAGGRPDAEDVRGRLARLDSLAAIEIVPENPDLLAIRKDVSELVASGEIPSMAIAVVSRGRVVWNEAVGFADRASGRLATPRTAYLVGSMSKSIMATGTLTLVERGLVGLDDPVAPALARRGLAIREYETNGRPIRLRDLLDMRAGLPHGWMTLPRAGPPDSAAAARYFGLMARSVFPPGEVYHYSNFSLSVPAAVIEGLTDTPFADYTRRRLFGPLGMSDAGVGMFDADPASLATGYGGDGQPIGVGYQFAAGGAGFVASATDLVQYALFHLGELEEVEPTVIGPALLEKQHAVPAAADSLFGLGWFVGRQQVSNGRVAGGSSWLSLVPEERLAVICLTNATTSAADAVCGRIVDALAPAVAAEGADAYQRYVETYENPYVPGDATTGRWEGAAEIGDRQVPVVLDLAEDGSAAVSIAGSDPVALENPVLNTRHVFKARTAEPMTLPTPLSGAPVETDVQLVLRLDEGRLYGYVAEIFGLDGGGYRLGSYVSLARSAPR
jgi:CubicO group peptidase (beta-lactamase class C family)